MVISRFSNGVLLCFGQNLASQDPNYSIFNLPLAYNSFYSIVATTTRATPQYTSRAVVLDGNTTLSKFSIIMNNHSGQLWDNWFNYISCGY